MFARLAAWSIVASPPSSRTAWMMRLSGMPRFGVFYAFISEAENCLVVFSYPDKLFFLEHREGSCPAALLWFVLASISSKEQLPPWDCSALVTAASFSRISIKDSASLLHQ